MRVELPCDPEARAFPGHVNTRWVDDTAVLEITDSAGTVLVRIVLTDQETLDWDAARSSLAGLISTGEQCLHQSM